MLIPSRPIIIGILLAIAPVVSWAQVTWTGAVNQVWDQGGNWAGGVAPTSTSDAVINNSSGMISPVAYSDFTVNNLTIGSSNASFNVGGNNLTLIGNDVTVNTNLRVGHAADSFGGLYLQAGADLTATVLSVGWSGQGAFESNGSTVTTRWTTAGQAAGSYAQIVINGGSWTNTESTFTIGSLGLAYALFYSGASVESTQAIIAYSNGTTGVDGSVSVTGENTLWTNHYTLTIGRSGDGLLNVASGGAVNNTYGEIILGANASGSGELRLNGGTFSSNNYGLTVGSSGAGIVKIANGGKLNSAATTYLGYASGSTATVIIAGEGSEWLHSGGGSMLIGWSGTATVDITNGGALKTTNADIGYSALGTGTVTVTGTDSTWSTYGNSQRVYVGTGGTGTLTVADGGLVDVGSIKVGGNSGSTGTLNLNEGGTIRLKWDGISAGAGTSTVNFAGGTVEFATRDQTLSAGIILADATNSTIDTSGYLITASGVISGDGALTKSGAGTLLMSSSNTYNGGTTVSGGTLRVNGSLASGVSVLDGATLAGTGFVSGIELASGASLAPGNSLGTFSSTSLIWNGGAVLNFELGASGSSDVLQLAGALTKGTGTDFVFNFQSTEASVGDAFELITGITSTTFDVGDFSFTSNLSGLSGIFSWVSGGTALQFSVIAGSAVPEPSTYAAILGVVALGFVAWRRRISIKSA